jgi:hypothetical protein
MSAGRKAVPASSGERFVRAIRASGEFYQGGGESPENCGRDGAGYIPVMDKNAIEQELKVAAGDLVDTVKKLVREGNVRRIIVRNAEGRTLVDMPLTAGVAGALLLPFFAMLTGLVALFKEFTIVVERHDTGVTKPE